MIKKSLLALAGAVMLSISWTLPPAAQAASAAITPLPRAAEYTGEVFPLPQKVYLTAASSVEETTVDLAAAGLKERGFKLTKKAAAADIIVELRIYNADKAAEPIGQRRSLSIKPEGYVVTIEQRATVPGRIIVEGNDAAGLFYGVKALDQVFDAGQLQNGRIEDYPEIRSRGIVEGFYGKPWSHQERLRQLKFLGDNRLNVYIYAPKDDPYHREKWRENYPEPEMRHIQELLRAAKANKVEFIYAISPGLDIAFGGIKGRRDYLALHDKLVSLYDAGVQSFAIFFDDINNKAGGDQAELINNLQHEFVAVRPDVKPLLTVPTEYFSNDMLDNNGGYKPYTQAFSAALNDAAQVLYTGPVVVSSSIPKADIAKINEAYRRQMGIWWNYPVNDYFAAKLALGPVQGLENTIGATDFLAINPMEQADLSRITLQTAAEFAWNPQNYDGEQAWRRAIAQQFGELAASMQIFADHTTHMEYSNWVSCGRPDAPELRQMINLLWYKLAAQKPVKAEIVLLKWQFSRMQAAADLLLNNLPPEVLDECRPQLLMLKQLAEYDQVAIMMVEAAAAGDKALAAKLRYQTEENWAMLQSIWLAANQPRELGQRLDPKLAVLSEQVAGAFLPEALSYIKNQEK